MAILNLWIWQGLFTANIEPILLIFNGGVRKIMKVENVQPEPLLKEIILYFVQMNIGIHLYIRKKFYEKAKSGL